MVSPTKKQKISKVPQSDPRFDKNFDEMLNTLFGVLNTEENVSYFHTKHPEILPLRTAKVIHTTLIADGYPSNMIPTLDELICMINREL